MPFSNAGKEVMLNALGGVAGYVSLHTSSPGSNGANEVSDAGVYERKAITWAAASGDNLDSSNTPVFDVPAATTITHLGIWSAATGGTYYGGNVLSAQETFTDAGQYTLTDLDLNLLDPV